MAYYCRGLTKAERNYSTTELECLEVVAAVKHFAYYPESFKSFIFGQNEKKVLQDLQGALINSATILFLVLFIELDHCMEMLGGIELDHCMEMLGGIELDHCMEMLGGIELDHCMEMLGGIELDHCMEMLGG